MFVVIEIQTSNGVTAVVPPVAYADRNEAEAKYHQVLSAAAISNVEIHSCTVLNEHGSAILSHFYNHDSN